PMERLRTRFPHALLLEFDPEGGSFQQRPVTARVAGRDERSVVADFVEWARGAPAGPEERTLIDTAVEQVRLQEGGRCCGCTTSLCRPSVPSQVPRESTSTA